MKRMLVLGIDTSGKSGGIALGEGDAHRFQILEMASIAGGTFSAQLVPTSASLLQRHGFGARDLVGFAAITGPGSFTGLRVGLSAVKGLAEVLHKPIAAVSLLEALATLASEDGSVGVAIDAGRSEVFWGLYQVASKMDQPLKINEDLLSQAEFLRRLSTSTLNTVIVTDSALAELVTASSPKPQAVKPRLQLVDRAASDLVARIGLRKLLAGDTVSAEALDANYMRRSDAELSFKGKR